ncbi:hypothetical protein V6U90_16045 [Micromonospora sp. CPCC 206060]|uniref:hypothetical protein n=1 Tax=Micromonospora sp. CPCC 206060 TaxID=3122406 RepID=UPI002FF17C3D
MRDGQKVTVKALTAMPGVADGEVLHVEWGLRLATLVDAGRYQVLEDGGGDRADAVVGAAGDGEQPGTAATVDPVTQVGAPAGDDEQPAGATARPRRTRSR